MEISRRHLQDTERAEFDKLRTILVEDGNLLTPGQLAEVERMKDQMVEMPGGAIDRELIRVQTRRSQERAEEMQRQVDGLTRNQRRVLNKRMRKAAKK